MNDRQTYKQFREEVAKEQQNMRRDDVVEHLKRQRDEYDETKPKYTHIFDPDTVTPQKHLWVDRGLVMSCEGAGHPYHRAFKRQR